MVSFFTLMRCARGKISLVLERFRVDDLLSCAFSSPVVSSMLAPALPEISKELRMPPGVVSKFVKSSRYGSNICQITENFSSPPASLTFSIFVLAYAVGPLYACTLYDPPSYR